MFLQNLTILSYHRVYLNKYYYSVFLLYNTSCNLEFILNSADIILQLAVEGKKKTLFNVCKILIINILLVQVQYHKTCTTTKEIYVVSRLNSQGQDKWPQISCGSGHAQRTIQFSVPYLSYLNYTQQLFNIIGKLETVKDSSLYIHRIPDCQLDAYLAGPNGPNPTPISPMGHKLKALFLFYLGAILKKKLKNKWTIVFPSNFWQCASFQN